MSYLSVFSPSARKYVPENSKCGSFSRSCYDLEKPFSIQNKRNNSKNLEKIFRVDGLWTWFSSISPLHLLICIYLICIYVLSRRIFTEMILNPSVSTKYITWPLYNFSVHKHRIVFSTDVLKMKTCFFKKENQFF